MRHLHGTAIAMIIRHICSNVEFISVNILDENLSTDGRILTYALSQVLDYQPDIIHMSLGTLKKRYIFTLKRIVKEARKLNILLVAAAENSGRISYPAYLNGVIGVKAAFFKNSSEYLHKHGFFYAPIGTEGISCIQKISEIKNAKGTSMAAAYISGHLAMILNDSKELSFKEAKETLIRKIEIEERGYE